METASKKEAIRDAVRAACAAFSEAEPVAITSAPAASANPATEFFGNLRNTKIPFPGVHLEEVRFSRRSEAENRALRLEFEKRGGHREAFIKAVVQDIATVERLKQAGIPIVQIARMQEQGRTPRGWQVHHKVPLAGGGSNDFDNLILVKFNPYYKAMTNEQNRRLQDVNASESRPLDWPFPEGRVLTLYGR